MIAMSPGLSRPASRVVRRSSRATPLTPGRARSRRRRVASFMDPMLPSAAPALPPPRGQRRASSPRASRGSAPPARPAAPSAAASASSSAACSRAVAVSAPASIRASSATRSSPVTIRTSLAVTARRRRRLVDDDVPVGERGDLGQVGDDQHLPVARQPGQPATDLDRRPAADAGVDLVEDQRGHRVGAGQAHLQRQHDPGQLAAGRARADRQRRRAGCGCSSSSTSSMPSGPTPTAAAVDRRAPAPGPTGRGRTSTATRASGIASPASSSRHRRRQLVGGRVAGAAQLGRPGRPRRPGLVALGRSAAMASSDTSIAASRARPRPPTAAPRRRQGRARRRTCGPARPARPGGPRPARAGPGRRPAARRRRQSAPSSAAAQPARPAGRPARRAPGRCRRAGRARARAAPSSVGDVGRVAARIVRVAEQRVVRGPGGEPSASACAEPRRDAPRARRPRPAAGRRPSISASPCRAGRSRGAARRPARPGRSSRASAARQRVEGRGVLGEVQPRRIGRAPPAARPGRTSRMLVGLAVHGDQLARRVRRAPRPAPARRRRRPASGPRADDAAQHQLGVVVDLAAGVADPLARGRVGRRPRAARRRWPARAPVRTRAASARPPNSSSSPVTTIVLPAPVSPVTTVSPGPSGSTASSITPSPRMRSLLQHRARAARLSGRLGGGGAASRRLRTGSWNLATSRSAKLQPARAGRCGPAARRARTCDPRAGRDRTERRPSQLSTPSCPALSRSMSTTRRRAPRRPAGRTARARRSAPAASRRRSAT